MNQKQEEHIDKICDGFTEEAWEKYEKGSKEHGGNLWQKANIIKMIKEEAIDLYIYACTLEKQIQKVKGFNKDKIKE